MSRVVRGSVSDTARGEAGVWRLPLAERPFGSLFQLQEGANKTVGGDHLAATLEEAK